MIRACSLAQCSGLARNRWRRGQGQRQGQQAQQAVNSHASRGCSFLSIYIRLQEHYSSLCQLLSSSRTVCEMGSSLLLRSSIPETLQLLSWKQEDMKAGRGSVQAWLDTAPSGGLLSRRGASCRSAENEPHNATGPAGNHAGSVLINPKPSTKSRGGKALNRTPLQNLQIAAHVVLLAQLRRPCLRRCGLPWPPARLKLYGLVNN